MSLNLQGKEKETKPHKALRMHLIKGIMVSKAAYMNSMAFPVLCW